MLRNQIIKWGKKSNILRTLLYEYSSNYRVAKVALMRVQQKSCIDVKSHYCSEKKVETIILDIDK